MVRMSAVDMNDDVADPTRPPESRKVPVVVGIVAFVMTVLVPLGFWLASTSAAGISPECPADGSPLTHLSCWMG